MTVLRWIFVLLAVLFASGAALAFAVYIGAGIDLWLVRAKWCKRWLSAVLLLWFNIEVWRRVVLVIIHW